MAISKKKDFWYRMLLAVAFCQSSFFMYFKYALDKIPVIKYVSFLFLPILYIVLFILAFDKERFETFYLRDAVFLIFVAASIGITYLIYPKNGVYISKALKEDILPCFPFFILGLCFFADEKTNKTLGLFSCFSIFASTLYLVYYLRNRELDNDSMYWSYLLLPNTLLAINYLFREKKLLGFIGSIVGVIYAFAMGTRGPILIIAVYAAICIWRMLKWKTATKIVVIGIVAGFVLLFISSDLYLNLLYKIKTYLQTRELSTRIVDFLISNKMISYTSGRDYIYEFLLHKLGQRPLIGYGIYGEWTYGFASAHNMYLEILFHFGYVLGISFIIIYLVLVLRGLLKCKNSYYVDIILIYSCFVFVQGLFGGSYLRPSVFFLLGLCLRSYRLAVKEKNESSTVIDDSCKYENNKNETEASLEYV